MKVINFRAQGKITISLCYFLLFTYSKTFCCRFSLFVFTNVSQCAHFMYTIFMILYSTCQYKKIQKHQNAQQRIKYTFATSLLFRFCERVSFRQIVCCCCFLFILREYCIFVLLFTVKNSPLSEFNCFSNVRRKNKTQGISCFLHLRQQSWSLFECIETMETVCNSFNSKSF